MSDQLTRIPLSQIHIAEGHNPRRVPDGDDLVKSIQQHGVISPIVVTPNADGYELVAGERRFLASCMADGVDDIPAMIRVPHGPKAGENRVVAILENLKRTDLTEVELAEAAHTLRSEGYTTRRQIATALNVSENKVKLWEQVMALPEDVRASIHEGRLPVSLAPVAAPIADVDPELCSLVVSMADEAGWSLPQFTSSWPNLISKLYTPQEVYNETTGEWELHDPDVDISKRSYWVVGENLDPNCFELDDKAANKLQEAVDTAPYGLSIRFEESDVDAARAFGCLIEFTTEETERYRAHTYQVITDREWMTDRFTTTIIPRLLKQARKSAKDKAEADARVAANSTKKPSVAEEAAQRGVEESVVKEERKTEREKEAEGREDAHNFNQQLGEQLFSRLNDVELTKPIADMIVGIVFRDDMSDIALRGLKYVHPAWVEDEEMKNGKIKHTFVDAHEEARKKATDFLSQATTAEEALARICQLVLAAEFADHDVVARSRRSGRQFHALQNAVGDCQKRIDAGIEHLAKKLTPKLRTEALRRRADRKKGGEWNA